MNCLACVQKLNNYRYAVVSVIFLLFMSISGTFAQSDPYGSMDRFYIESVTASPGTDVLVHFYMQNDEPISSISIPLVYNSDYLTLKSIDFTGSRADYIANKITTPASVEQTDGHFLVSFFTILEDPVPPGDGMVFSATFSVADSATEGMSFAFDTLFYPPGGEYLYVEASTAGQIIPQFEPGQITIAEKNYPPVISSSTSETVFEGDSLEITINASDANNDSLIFVCSNKPSGSVLEMLDSKTARFRWQPDYVGPYSSDGSPFDLNISVSDGTVATNSQIAINVVNKNRKPVVTAVNQLQFESGDLVEFNVDGSDPDFDPVTWQIENLPEGAVFQDGSPAKVSWQTSVADTGNFDMTFIVSDPQGYADTTSVALYLKAVLQYEMSIDTISAYPGDKVTLNINLDNKDAIGAFNLLVKYDPSALSLLSVDNASSRTSSFDTFQYTPDADNIIGDVRITGIADQSGQNTKYLPAGNGSILSMQFRVFGNVNLSGITIPVRFVFLDEPDYNDNTFTDTLGQKVEQGAIGYFDGYIQVESLGDILIGDINLNGIAFDIGDAVYFTNYFMNPFLYPFNPLQYANSDVNQDNIVASVADLVSLINVITDGGKTAPKPIVGDKLTASIDYTKDAEGVVLNYDADFNVGAILLKLENGSFDEAAIGNLNDGMTMDYYRDDNSSRILIYSMDGNTLPVGTNGFLQINGVDDIKIISAELASSDGRLADLRTTHKVVELPNSFELFQNYPNPFNPETHIGFALPQASKVRLAIYNILGEKIRVLIDEEMTAGVYEAVWNGRDDNGMEVSSGVYLYRLETEKNRTSKKMLFLK